MKQDQNRQLIARFYLEMWNRFDKTIFPDILTEDIRFRGSLGQHKNGYAEFGEYVDFIQRAFPDFSNEIEEIISEDDKAFAKLIYRGTHRGAVFGIEPTGVPVGDVQEVSNHVKAMEYGFTRLKKDLLLSLRLIEEIHNVLLENVRGGDKEPGEFRRSQNWVGGTRTGNAIYVPPPVPEILPAMGALEKVSA